jgi:hypothetical protein
MRQTYDVHGRVGGGMRSVHNIMSAASVKCCYCKSSENYIQMLGLAVIVYFVRGYYLLLLQGNPTEYVSGLNSLYCSSPNFHE